MDLLKLFTKTPEAAPHNAPENTRIYAIGDIHGTLPPLLELHERIMAEEKKRAPKERKVIIYLGDYIDRGLQSKEVIEHLISAPLPGFEQIFIKGNHEHAMMEFLRGPERKDTWLLWGGDATIQGYGVPLEHHLFNNINLKEIATSLAKKIPETHKKFFSKLRIQHIEGDYIFVHAGFRPGIPLAEQQDEDKMMIRDEFIYSPKNFGKTVVFGHTIFNEPFIASGRIGVDTGSYASGKLTAAVLENDKIDFIFSK